MKEGSDGSLQLDGLVVIIFDTLGLCRHCQLHSLESSLQAELGFVLSLVCQFLDALFGEELTEE